MVKQHFSWGSQRFASSTNADWHHKTHEEVMWAMVNGQAGTGTTTTTTTATAAAAASLLSDQKYLIMNASSVSHRIGDILSQAKDISPQLLYKLMTTSYLKKFLLYSKFIVLMLDQHPAVRAIYPEFGDLSHLRLFYDQSIFLTSPSWLALQHQCVKTAKTAKATAKATPKKDASNTVAFGTFTYLFQRLRGLFVQVLLLPLLAHYGHNVVATPLRSEQHRLQWEQVGDDPTFHFEAEHYDRLAQLPPPLLQTLCQALKHFITQDSTCGWLVGWLVGWWGGWLVGWLVRWF